MTATIWPTINRSLRRGRELRNRTNTPLGIATYRVAEVSETGIIAQRIATGSMVRVTRRMIEKTLDRLAGGEAIPFRSISYTVAIETVVVAALLAIDAIEIDNATKTYVTP